MPRKSKAQTEQPAATSEASPPEPAEMPAADVRKTARKSVARKPATKKSTATRTKRNQAARSERRQATDEEIRMRAYFIAERRVQMGAPGSEHDDWLEAKRQLEAELGS